MTRSLLIHRRWMTALALVTACGDDGTVASSTDSETDEDTSADDVADDVADDSTDTIEPDSSGSASESSTDPSTSDTGTESDSGSSTDTGDLCGNGDVDDGEVCDGSNLLDTTCSGLGHLGGELACADDCQSFDETGCFDMSCGDEMITGDEECDGEDLGIGTCMMQGFDGGVLACDPATCEFDTGECVLFSCGDGVLNDVREQCDIADFGPNDSCEALGLGAGTIVCTEQCTIETAACCGSDSIGGAEVCDGTDFGGQTCGSFDFDGGLLACNEDCSGIDTSGCTTCGDSLVEGTESCDTDNLDGNACNTVPGGFVGGVLACDATCSFDTTGCNFCGNDVVNPGEACDGEDLDDATCLTLDHTGGALACDGACSFDESNCTDIPLPGAGEIVITEIMQNPAAVVDEMGEYFEVHNPSLVESFQLRGCTVEDDDGGESFPISTDLVIDAGDYLTFARTAAPGFTPDFVWPGNVFVLNNAADTIRLVCDGTAIDEVAYGGALPWPDPTGASMQLDPGFLTTTDNDDGANWCESFGDLGNGDSGTPGAANVGCAADDFAIDFCNLESPVTIDAVQGDSQTVFGRLFIAGLTDLTAMNDPAANVIGSVGYGPDGTDPAVDLGWTWFEGMPNPAWIGMGVDVDNDEYQASFNAPAEGAYDFAFRFTGDGGATFTYCDSDGTDANDEYEIANAGSMETQPAGAPPGLYFSEYLEGAMNNKVVEIWNPGAAVADLDLCSVRVYSNGAAMPSSTIALTDVDLAASDAWVLCNPQADAVLLLPLCDQTSGSLNHSGDDALELVCNGTTLDVIGQIGVDPGVEWVANGVSTLNQDLRRDCAVVAGDPIGNDAFDPSLQWDNFLLTDFSNLGVRGCP